ncbi:MAG: metallophosphoesterase [Cytophagales bacterium]|nr:metallophosphoesterase [Cytophagales bacterium]
MIVQKELPIIETNIKNGKVLIGSDFHVPFQDKDAVDCFIEKAIELQPEAIVINGDLLDFYRLSRFSKGEGRNPMEEIIEAKTILETLRYHCKDSKIYYPIGNHESRLEKYIYDKAPEIISIVDNFYELLKCKDIEVQGCHKVIFNNEFICKHGNLLGNKSGLSAIKEMEKSFASGATGHTHRLAKFITRKAEKKFVWLETGCLCTMKPEYMLEPDWQQGFALIEFRKSKLYKADVFEIENGEVL